MTIFTPTKTPYSLRGLLTSGFLDETGLDIISDALENGRRILVTGPTGSGKSVLLDTMLASQRTAFELVSGRTPAVPGFCAAQEPRAELPLFLDLECHLPLKPELVTDDERTAAEQLKAEVTDLFGTGRVRVVTAQARAAGGALRGLEQLLKDSEKDLVELIDLVVTCGRRTVTLDGRELKRRVVVSIEALEGRDDSGRFVLTELYRAEQEDGSVSWRTPPRSLHPEASWYDLAELLDALDVLVSGHAARSRQGELFDTHEMLTTLSRYGGGLGELCKDLLEGYEPGSQKIEDWPLNPFLESPVLVMEPMEKLLLEELHRSELYGGRSASQSYLLALTRLRTIARRRGQGLAHMQPPRYYWSSVGDQYSPLDELRGA